MKIALATSLYPPDIAPVASYVKALASRLSKTHEVTVITYGHVPEKVPGVRIVAIEKRHLIPLRLFLYTFALWRESLRAHLIFMQNGASVELPALIVSFLTRTPIFFRFGDTAAHEWAHKNTFRRLIENFALKRSRLITLDDPLPRPEILPFDPPPVAALAAHKSSWEKHTHVLLELFGHAL